MNQEAIQIISQISTLDSLMLPNTSLNIDKKIDDCEDPQQEEGHRKNSHILTKKKQVKILSGFFPVFIYFPIETNSQIPQISNTIKKFLQQKDINFEELKEKHITLTKTINILQSQIKQTHAKIQKSLKGRVILPIILLFKRVKILSNFICVQVEKVTALKLQKVTEIIGETIKQPYFQNPIYHVSLFKLCQKPIAQLIENIENIKLNVRTALLLSSLEMNAGIKKLKFMIK